MRPIRFSQMGRLVLSSPGSRACRCCAAAAGIVHQTFLGFGTCKSEPFADTTSLKAVMQQFVNGCLSENASLSDSPQRCRLIQESS